MSMNTFRNAFPNGTPRKLRMNSISDELYDAGGKSLGCIGVFEIDFEVHGRRIKHPVRLLQHVTEDIIGIDFINTHHLWYDPVHREVFFNKTTKQRHCNTFTHARNTSEVENCSPCDIKLERGSTIATVESGKIKSKNSTENKLITSSTKSKKQQQRFNSQCT